MPLSILIATIFWLILRVYGGCPVNTPVRELDFTVDDGVKLSAEGLASRGYLYLPNVAGGATALYAQLGPWPLVDPRPFTVIFRFLYRHLVEPKGDRLLFVGLTDQQLMLSGLMTYHVNGHMFSMHCGAKEYGEGPLGQAPANFQFEGRVHFGTRTANLRMPMSVPSAAWRVASMTFDVVPEPRLQMCLDDVCVTSTTADQPEVAAAPLNASFLGGDVFLGARGPDTIERLASAALDDVSFYQRALSETERRSVARGECFAAVDPPPFTCAEQAIAYYRPLSPVPSLASASDPDLLMKAPAADRPEARRWRSPPLDAINGRRPFSVAIDLELVQSLLPDGQAVISLVDEAAVGAAQVNSALVVVRRGDVLALDMSPAMRASINTTGLTVRGFPVAFDADVQWPLAPGAAGQPYQFVLVCAADHVDVYLNSVRSHTLQMALGHQQPRLELAAFAAVRSVVFAPFAATDTVARAMLHSCDEQISGPPSTTTQSPPVVGSKFGLTTPSAADEPPQGLDPSVFAAAAGGCIVLLLLLLLLLFLFCVVPVRRRRKQRQSPGSQQGVQLSAPGATPPSGRSRAGSRHRSRRASLSANNNRHVSRRIPGAMLSSHQQHGYEQAPSHPHQPRTYTYSQAPSGGPSDLVSHYVPLREKQEQPNTINHDNINNDARPGHLPSSPSPSTYYEFQRRPVGHYSEFSAPSFDEDQATPVVYESAANMVRPLTSAYGGFVPSEITDKRAPAGQYEILSPQWRLGTNYQNQV